MQNREFEDATRQSALEIVNTLAENMATLLRKHADQLQQHLFPAYAYMMAEVDMADDLDSWLAEEDYEI